MVRRPRNTKRRPSTSGDVMLRTTKEIERKKEEKNNHKFKLNI